MKGQTEEKLHKKNDFFLSEKNTNNGRNTQKKKKERKDDAREAVVVAEMERLKLGPTEIWTGLVLHREDILVRVLVFFMNFSSSKLKSDKKNSQKIVQRTTPFT